MRALGVVLLLAAAVPFGGCGVQPSGDAACVTALEVTPQTAVVSSAAAAPGNQQKFIGVYTTKTAGCAAPTIVAPQTWTVSDPVNVSISSAQDGTNGVATCLGKTSGPVTVNASTTMTTIPGQITCE